MGQIEGSITSDLGLDEHNYAGRLQTYGSLAPTIFDAGTADLELTIKALQERERFYLKHYQEPWYRRVFKKKRTPEHE